MKVPPEINIPRPGAPLVVGRDPGKDEMAYRLDEQTGVEYPNGRPFVGKAGELLGSVLAECGWLREEVNIANVLGYQPEDNKFSNHDERTVEEGVAEVRQLAERLKPSLIITLGNEASYTFIDGWPTKGRGVFGAKKIEDRRGYFWDTPYGTVLSTLHPAGVLRKAVPGDYLLRADFKRARRWLEGTLPRDEFPEIRRLTSQNQVERLISSSLIGWDIETKWDNTADLCHGFTGDDLQPYVAVVPWEFEMYGRQILEASVPKAGHNGYSFDVPAMRLFHNLMVNSYLHDTMTMWWALEPELAGTDETGEESMEEERRRMTRKGLAFLASLYFNLPWWKNYPEDDDPEHLQKMMVIGGIDSWATRCMAGWMLKEIETEGVSYQYDQARNLFPTLIELHLRGLPVDEELRKERHSALESRYKALGAQAEQVGLSYVSQHDIPAFRVFRECSCCGGGTIQRKHCVRCSGYFTCSIPDKLTPVHAKAFEYKSLKAFKESFPVCETCQGSGKVKSYHFNPYSEDQQKKLLYDVLGVPKHTWKGKTQTDQQALKKILRWSKE